MRSSIHKAHLTYCSNIHAGETWPQTLANLQNYTTKVRDNLTEELFGIGLRLSDEASIQLSNPKHLQIFKSWLKQENMYVFTINGFPYGGFHGQKVKELVHKPDWTTPERLDYTIRLFDILKELLPAGMDGGVSTSPLSYRFWHKDEMALKAVKIKATEQLMQLVSHLDAIYQTTGQTLHLDIEPEPDGVLETTEEFINFYQNYLVEIGVPLLAQLLGCTGEEAEEKIRRHLQLCYDVCHFAVGFENPAEALERIEKAQIKIGRIQISAALSSGLIKSDEARSIAIRELSKFDEPTYLHQAVVRNSQGILSRYPDLKPALDVWKGEEPTELRTHYHVPVFTEHYGTLISTQQDIIDVLDIWKKTNFTNHLEVETYTWDVLPQDMRSDIVSLITRELSWVQTLLAS
jgi:hypothetical protein